MLIDVGGGRQGAFARQSPNSICLPFGLPSTPPHTFLAGLQDIALLAAPCLALLCFRCCLPLFKPFFYAAGLGVLLQLILRSKRLVCV